MHFLCCWSRLPWPQFPHLFNLFNPHPRIALGVEKVGLLEKRPFLLSSPRPRSSRARFLISGRGASRAALRLSSALVGVSSSGEEEEGEAAARSQLSPAPPRSTPVPRPPAPLPRPRQQPPAPPRAPRAPRPARPPGDPARWGRAPGSRSAQLREAGGEQGARGSHAAPEWPRGPQAQVRPRHGAGGLQGAVPVAVRLQDREVCHRQEQEGGPALPAAAGLHPDLPGGVSSPGALGEWGRLRAAGNWMCVPGLGKGLLGVRVAGEEGALCFPTGSGGDEMRAGTSAFRIYEAVRGLLIPSGLSSGC